MKVASVHPALAMVLVLAGVGGCGCKPARPADPAPAVTPADDATAGAAADAASEPEAPLVAVAATIGLDLRALPTGTDEGGIDLFVLGQGDDLRALAPPEVAVEIRHVPGAGVLIPVFRAATEADALSACTRTVTAYLAQAPRLPLVREAAAQLITPCAVAIAPASDTTTQRDSDGVCAPEPEAGTRCGEDDSWCVLSWGEPGGASTALWCRDGRWVLETEPNEPFDDP